MINMPGEYSPTTRHALREAILTPRFYTTDFRAIDRLNITHMRNEFDWIRNEFEFDYNKKHFCAQRGVSGKLRRYARS